MKSSKFLSYKLLCDVICKCYFIIKTKIKIKNIKNYNHLESVKLKNEEIKNYMLTYQHRNDGQHRSIDDSFENKMVDLIRHLRLVDKKIQTQLGRLSAIHKIDLMIMTSSDLKAILKFLLEQVIRQLEVDASEIFLLDFNELGLLSFVKAGRHSVPVSERKILLEQAEQIVNTRCAIKSYNFNEKESISADTQTDIKGRSYQAYVGLPLITQGELKGVLAIMNNIPLKPNAAWLNFLDTLANQATIAIKNAQLMQSIALHTEKLAAEVNERKRMERSLKLINNKYSAFFEQSKDVIFIFSPDGRIIDLNPAGLALFGYNKAEIMELNAVDFYVNPEDPIHFQNKIQQKGSIKDFEVKVHKKDGREMDALITATLNKAEDGSILSYQGILRDITQQKRTEKLLAEYSRTLERQVEQRTAQLQARVQELNTLNRITQTVASVSDLHIALEIVSQEITTLFNASYVSISLLNRLGTELTIAAEYPSKQNDTNMTGIIVSLDDELDLISLINRGQSIIINEPQSDPLLSQMAHFPLGPWRMEAMMVIPLLARGKTIGVIEIGIESKDRRFKLSELSLAETIAGQIASAVENARLFSEEQHQRQMAESLREVATVITNSLDRDTVLAKIMEQLGHVIQYDEALLLLVDGEELVVSSTVNLPNVSSGHCFSLSGLGPAIEVFKNKQPLIIPDIHLNPTWQACVPSENVRSWMGAPLLTEGQAIGVLIVDHFKTEAYNDDDAQVLQLFAHQAAIAIKNSELFESEQKANQSLAETLQQLKTSQNQLIIQEKMAWLGMLTSGIAHEIRNPLNFVNNFAALSVELMQELHEVLESQQAKLDPATQQEIQSLLKNLRTNASCIHEEGQRAERIVRSMLLHSRGTAGQPQETDLNTLLAEAVHLAYHSLRAKNINFNISIKMDYDSTLKFVSVVPQDLSRAFLNLINNACYATHQKKIKLGADYSPLLKVTTKNLADERVEIRIYDNGMGIPPDVRSQIFNPFFTTKPPGEGTGLGLSISYDVIVQGHQGSIQLNTQVGHYTEFVITLPK